MGFKLPSPDHNNYSLFGKAWKDRFNDVTELSAKIGSGSTDLKNDEERHAHQHKLLQARLNTYLDSASTPVVKTKTTIGRMEVPYVKSPLPAMRDAHILPSFSRARGASMRSFNESKAVSKFRGDYLRCDETVRQSFLEKIRNDIDHLQDNKLAREKLEILHSELLRLSGKKHEDLEALTTRSQGLKERQAEVGGMRGIEKLRGQAGLLLNRTDSKLRSIDRKTNEIFSPSSYELHRVHNNGDKVTNLPLYVKEIQKNRRGQNNNIHDLRTEIGIRNFTEAQFDALADAMRGFCRQVRESAGSVASDEQALRDAAKPILYSGERHAVHRFIRDMVRQLKRAGVPAAELDEINTLVPDKPSSAQALVQGLVPGTGKQMRLQDEAERMAKALPKVLRLTVKHGIRLQQNLMHFDLSKVQALIEHVNNNDQATSDAMEFVRSTQGQAFIDAIISKAEERLGTGNGQVEPLKTRSVRKDPRGTLTATAILLRNLRKMNPPAWDSDTHMVRENQHLFMVTSDTEFWEREAVDKVATRLIEDHDVNATKKSRIFKQMKLRAAATGMDANQVEAYMIQGITNTLRNRSMTIEGTKIAGVIGSVAGNLSSTPLSVAAAPYAPFLALPGIMDLGLMPAGWAIGQIPGALFGATVLDRMKDDRLQEAGQNTDVVRFDLSGEWSPPALKSTYISATKNLKPSLRTIVKQANIEKPSLTSMVRESFSQYGHAHGQVWKGMAKEISSLVWNPLRYAFYTGPKDAWKDLVLHNDPALLKNQEINYTFASTPFETDDAGNAGTYLASGSRSTELSPSNEVPVGALAPTAQEVDWGTTADADKKWRERLYDDHRRSGESR